MPNETAGFTNDLGDIKAKLDSALVGVRIAEKMAVDATQAIERLQAVLKLRPQSPPTPPPDITETTALAVRPKVACKMLDCSMSSLYGMISNDELDVYKDGKATKITVASINRRIQRKVSRGKAP